jgi:hypothetical protein
MQGTHLLLIGSCPGAALLVQKNSTLCSNRANCGSEKIGKSRQTAKISGYGRVRARPLKCRA